jgi:long-chain acyl-CoA synthetase
VWIAVFGDVAMAESCVHCGADAVVVNAECLRSTGPGDSVWDKEVGMSAAIGSNARPINPALMSRRLIARLAAVHGSRVMLSNQKEQLTYSEVASIVHGRARQMREAGVEGRVVVSLPSSIEFIFSVFALLESGAVPVLTNPRLTSRERNSIREDCCAAWCVQGSDSGTMLRALDSSGNVVKELLLGTEPNTPLPAELGDEPEAANADAFMLYTSGSTGRMKGVVHTLGALVQNSSQVGVTVGACPDDRFVSIVPAFHSFGFSFGIAAAIINGATICRPENVGAIGLLEQIERESITVLTCPASLLRQLVVLAESRTVDLSRLRLIVSGGEVLRPHETEAAMQRLCPNIVNIYGTSEAGGITAIRPGDPHERAVTTVGRALDGIELRIVDADHSPVPCGTLGEVACRTPGCFREYLNLPEVTRRTKDEAGWYYTGDLGQLDEAGFLTLLGRKDDLINKQGFKVHPAEIYAILSGHPAVADCVVVGVADERSGSRIRAVVALKSGNTLSARELKSHCAQHLTYYKVPDEILVVDALPRNPIGKVDRELVRSAGWPRNIGAQP